MLSNTQRSAALGSDRAEQRRNRKSQESMSNQTETHDMDEPSGLRSALDAAKAEAAAALDSANAATRQLAVFQAGVPTTPVGKLFAQSYEGEASPESIQAAWKALGVDDMAPPTSETHAPTPTEANMTSMVAQGLTPEAPIAALTPEQERIQSILEYDAKGDQMGLQDFLQSQGMLMDPEQQEADMGGWINQAPRPSGIDLGAAANPAGHNPQVVT